MVTKKYFVLGSTSKGDITELRRGAKRGAEIPTKNLDGFDVYPPGETVPSGPFKGTLTETFTQNANDRDGSGKAKLYIVDYENSTAGKTVTKLSEEEITVYCRMLGESKTIETDKVLTIAFYPSLNRYEIDNAEC